MRWLAVPILLASLSAPAAAQEPHECPDGCCANPGWARIERKPEANAPGCAPGLCVWTNQDAWFQRDAEARAALMVAANKQREREIAARQAELDRQMRLGKQGLAACGAIGLALKVIWLAGLRWRAGSCEGEAVMGEIPAE